MLMLRKGSSKGQAALITVEDGFKRLTCIFIINVDLANIELCHLFEGAILSKQFFVTLIEFVSNFVETCFCSVLGPLSQ